MCVAGVREGVRERFCPRQTQADAQRRTEIRVQHVREGVQTTGPPVSLPGQTEPPYRGLV